MFLNFYKVWKGKSYDSPSGIRNHDLKIRSGRSNPLGLQNNYQIILDFIAYFDRKKLEHHNMEVSHTLTSAPIK